MEFATYLKYLQEEKKMSKNTLEAYNRDLVAFQKLMAEKGIYDIKNTTNTDIISYLLKLKNDGKSPATVNRKLASLRTFFAFLYETKQISENPTTNIKSPKIERKELEYIPIEEIDRLLLLPDKTPKGLRDRAILEMMYATGLRVSEVIETTTIDINLRMGFVMCSGNHAKARVVPLGRPARAAIEEYVYDARPSLIKEQSPTDVLFVNYNGEPLTRQGLWKILKEYAEKAELSVKLTPQTLRNSFAVHMLQNGADLKALQEMLGHEDIAATQIYLSATKSRIKDVYDKSHPRA